MVDGFRYFHYRKRVEINMNGSCWPKQCSSVSRMVDVEVIELLIRGRMLRYNQKLTYGNFPTGIKALFVTGGNFLLKLPQMVMFYNLFVLYK